MAEEQLAEVSRLVRDYYQGEAGLEAVNRAGLLNRAREAMQLLRGRGYRAIRLEDGYPEWQTPNGYYNLERLLKGLLFQGRRRAPE